MIDKNFRMIDTSGGIVTALRARFDGKCLSDEKYIKKHELDKTTFSKLMKRRVTGTKSKGPDTTVGKIIFQLKKDGIWWGKLPWEARDDCKRVS